MGRPAITPKKSQTEKAVRFIRIAEAVYGKQWQTPAAKAIGKACATLNDYARKGTSPTEATLAKLIDVARARAKNIIEIIGE